MQWPAGQLCTELVTLVQQRQTIIVQRLQKKTTTFSGSSDILEGWLHFSFNFQGVSLCHHRYKR